MLCGTICLIMLGTVSVALMYPPGTVTDAFRQKIFELLTFILGVVGGWLLGKGESEPPDKPPSDTK